MAEQGLAGRRAGQPARRDHGSRFDDRHLERPPSRHDAQRRRHDDVRVVRQPSPINNYNIEVNAGRYAHFGDVCDGEKRPLTSTTGRSPITLDTAKMQFRQAIRCCKCFEHWFGPYPWYEDGYKLIEAPHLGMEHQSGVAYGNRLQERLLAAATSRAPARA